MAVRLVAEVARVPDHDVGADDRLAVDEGVEVGARGGRHRAVVDLARPVAQGPEVADAVVVRLAVVRPGNDHVALVAALRADAPAPLAARVAPAADLMPQRVPVPVVARERRVVVLEHDVLAGARDVEVQPPVRMMVMDLADTRVVDRAEAEARADRAVGMQPPAADVAVPAGRELADQHHLLVVHVDRHAGEVAVVVAGVEHRLGRLGAEPEAGRHRGALGLEAALLVLPVAVRAAGVVVVADVEDRHVRPPQHALAAVGDPAQLDARAHVARRGRRPDGDQPPQGLAVAGHGDAGGARARGRGRLVRVGNAAAARPGHRRRGRLALEAHDLAPAEPHADDLVVLGALRRPQADGKHALDAAVGELLAGERGHRSVGDEPALAQRRAELGVLAQELDGGLQLVGAWQRLAGGRDQPRGAALVERHVDEQRALLRVVVELGPHAARRRGLVARVHRLEADEPRLRLPQLGAHGGLADR